MAKDVNIHVKTPGAPQSKQQLDTVAESTRKIGDKSKEGAKGVNELGKSTGKSEGLFSKFTSGLKSWAVSLVGITAIIAGITKAIRIQIEALKEHAQIATEQQKKLLALQAMGKFYEEHPEAREQIRKWAEFGVRPFPEVAEAWYTLESKGAGLTEAQKKGIMQEALELGRMEPEADLKAIIDVFSIYAKESRQQDINQIQNVIRQTLSVAGAELSQMGRYLPEFLSLGISGGLTPAETAGLWAYATTRAPSVEKATVGIRNIFSALRGKGTPESKELLQQLGITPEMTIFEQLTALSTAQRAGKFGVPEAEIIAGRENIAVLMSMLTEPQAMMQVVRQVTEVARPDIDITKQRLDQIMGTDEIACLEENLRRSKIAIENLKGESPKALRMALLLSEYERLMREAEAPEILIRYELAKAQLITGLGVSAEEYLAKESMIPVIPEYWEKQTFPGNIVTINNNNVIYTPIVGEPRKGLRSPPP